MLCDLTTYVLLNVDNMTTKENEVLMANYSIFCDILKGELNLLPKFVQVNILTADQSQDIPSIPITQRGEAILKCIVGPVQGGQTGGFYAMLRIMKEHDKTDTQMFTSKIEMELGNPDDTFAYTGISDYTLILIVLKFRMFLVIHLNSESMYVKRWYLSLHKESILECQGVCLVIVRF